MKPADDPYQDLTRIRGIGEARQKIFRDELDVRSYRDLANLDVDFALTVFRKHSEAISRDMLESWAEIAAELELEIPRPPDSAVSGYSVKIPETNNGWQAFATFVVDYQVKPSGDGRQFQTIAHYMQKDETRIWGDIDTDAYSEWINQQLADSEFGLEPVGAAKPHAYSAKIREIRFGNRASDKKIPREQVSPVRILLDLGEQSIPASQLSSIRCRTRCLLHHLDSGEYREITQEQPLLSAGEEGYETFLGGVTIEPGNYRMWITVVLNSSRSIPHFTELDDLEVVDHQ